MLSLGAHQLEVKFSIIDNRLNGKTSGVGATHYSPITDIMHLTDIVDRIINIKVPGGRRPTKHGTNVVNRF